MNVNKAIILGRTTKDPEIKKTPNGKSVVDISIATNYSYKNANGEKISEVEYHEIVAFGSLADIIAKYVVKGQIVYIEGKIKKVEWTSKDGNKKNKTQIIADTLQMGPGPKREEPVEEAIIQ